MTGEMLIPSRGHLSLYGRFFRCTALDVFFGKLFVFL
jgi:hypothetical protein